MKVLSIILMIWRTEIILPEGIIKISLVNAEFAINQSIKRFIQLFVYLQAFPWNNAHKYRYKSSLTSNINLHDRKA